MNLLKIRDKIITLKLKTFFIMQAVSFLFIIFWNHLFKPYGSQDFFLFPIVGAAFYAGSVGGLAAGLLSSALILIMNPYVTTTTKALVFIIVGVHAGIASDMLKIQLSKLKKLNQKLIVHQEQIKEHSKIVETLREIDAMILESVDLQQILDYITKQVAKIFKARNCYITLEGKEGIISSYGPLKEIFGVSTPLIVNKRNIGSITVSFSKPKNFTQHNRFIGFAHQAAIAINNAELMASLRNLSIETIRALVKAIEAREPNTAGHSDRVSKFATLIATKLGLSKKEIELVKYASLLHDVGKLGVDENIVRKDSSLSKIEHQIIKSHPELGAEIIKPVKYLEEAITWIYSHQEKVDGTGYPKGITGDKIPLGAKIIAVADAYEAMTSDRPYRKAMSSEEAKKELAKYSGKQFDSEVVNALIEIL